MVPQSQRAQGRLALAGWGAVILGLVLACYWPALTGAMVWDDGSHVTRADLRGLSGLGRIWSGVRATEQYYPVLHSAFWVEHRIWGDSTLGYHLANVVLHALACCLLAVVLQRLGGLRGRPPESPGGPHPGALPAGAAVLAAVLFAVHPVCVESVAWMSEQKNTLSLNFYLLAGLAFLSFRESGRLRSYLLASALFVLALGTKSVTSSLPAALLVVLWWVNGRVSWRREVRPLIPWFLAALAAGVVTAWVERSVIGASGAVFVLPPLQRLLLASRILWFYLSKLAWPSELLFFYPHWDVPAESGAWYGYLAAAVALTLVLFLIRGRCRGPLAAWLFFAGSLFPALGFVNVYPFLFSYVADHFQYLASLGIFAAAAIGFAGALSRLAPALRPAGWAVAAVVIAALVLRSNRQSREYQGPEPLYRAILAGNPESWKAHDLLGDELSARPGGSAEALGEFSRGVDLNPADGEAQNNLGTMLLRVSGDKAAAREHFLLAERYAPGLAEPHLNLANILAGTQGGGAEALREYREALRLNPNSVAAHFGLANALAAAPMGEAEAVSEYEAALSLDPENVPARVNLAGELARIPGREADALANYARVLHSHPGLAPVHFNLAILLSRLPGRSDDAVAEYLETLRINPGFADAHRNLGIEYAKKGLIDKAEYEWRLALEINPGFSDLRERLELLQREKAR